MTLTAVIQSDKSTSNIPVYNPQPQKHSAPSSLKDPRISNIVDLENRMRNIKKIMILSKQLKTIFSYRNTVYIASLSEGQITRSISYSKVKKQKNTRTYIKV